MSPGAVAALAPAAAAAAPACLSCYAVHKLLFIRPAVVMFKQVVQLLLPLPSIAKATAAVITTFTLSLIHI